MTHLPLWGGCVMLTHTLNTLSNLVEQAVYSLLPAHLTPSSLLYTHNQHHPHLAHQILHSPHPLTMPPYSNTFPHGENYRPCLHAWGGCTMYPEHLTTCIWLYVNIILSTSHIYSTSYTPTPTTHHPHLTQHTPHSCTIYTIHTSHRTP